MGVWRPAGRPQVAFRRAAGRSACWPRRARYARALRRLCSCASAAVAVFLLFRGVCALYPDLFRTPPAPDDASPVTLLVWSHPFGRRGALPDCLGLYRIGGCTITDDASAYRAADAVIFHHREIASGSARLPPEPRPRAQKWIWLNYESPTHTRRLWLLEGVFNLTMSYRSDSDIFLPYGYLFPRARTAGAPPDEVARRVAGRRPRRRFAAWVISNWSEKHARVAFYHRLRRYVQVDVFGRAGRPLPRAGEGGGVARLAARYSFYLALENSQHTDYITEKLWNAVRAGAVPVVLGPPRLNYERFLPPEAFIHVDDFPTVRELARYLLALGRSPSRMKRHLDWRGGYSVRQPAFWAEHYCTACRAVRGTRGRTDVVQGLAQWFTS